MIHSIPVRSPLEVTNNECKKGSDEESIQADMFNSGHAQTIYSAMADFSKDDPITYER